ncbi:MAG: Ig domain-containing protein [Phycisphaerae bacterium]|nr:Ig domain-containing protein [Gemmatimonadaceae bacterium]
MSDSNCFSLVKDSLTRLRVMALVSLVAVASCSEGDPVVPESVTIDVSPDSASIYAGSVQTFTATVSGTSDTAVEWQSSAPTIATVTNAGVVTAVAAGNAVLTATSVRDRSKTATVDIKVLSLFYPLTGTYDLTFVFDSTRFEVTAPFDGCPTTQTYCTYTRLAGAKSTLSGTLIIPEQTFVFTPQFPSGPPRLVSLVQVMMSGRFCVTPIAGDPVGCARFEDVPMSRHSGNMDRVQTIPGTKSFVRLDSGAVSGDFPTERYLSLTYDVHADSLHGRALWILYKNFRSPTAQLGSFVARRRK